MTLVGRCLCGSVRFEIRPSSSGDGVGPFAYCHCQSCRRASGSAFAANAPVAEERVTWLAGRDAIREYESSPGKLRAFCSGCGSPVYARQRGAPGVLSIRMGLIDADPGGRPQAHFNVSEKAPWYPIHDALPRHAHDDPE